MFGQMRTFVRYPAAPLVNNKSQHRADKDKDRDTKDNCIGQVKAIAFTPCLDISKDSKAASEECDERSGYADDGEECAGHDDSPFCGKLWCSSLPLTMYSTRRS